MKKGVLVLGLIISVFLLANYMMPTHHTGEHHGILEVIRAHEALPNYAIENIGFYDTSQLIKVHSKLDGVGDFFTEKRTPNITSWQCSNCHNTSLSSLQGDDIASTKNAHWNIELAHGKAEFMSCKTCHSTSNMDMLSGLSDKEIHIDNSFKLCGQCHSTQLNDWEGGAHGKQLNGWTNPRVAKTCVSCHNPHKPGFPKRYPSRLNTKALGFDN